MTGWGRCLESRRLADVWDIRQGSNVRKRMSEREEANWRMATVIMNYVSVGVLVTIQQLSAVNLMVSS